jgi:hypothetical protein
MAGQALRARMIDANTCSAMGVTEMRLQQGRKARCPALKMNYPKLKSAASCSRTMPKADIAVPSL